MKTYIVEIVEKGENYFEGTNSNLYFTEEELREYVSSSYEMDKINEWHLELEEANVDFTKGEIKEGIYEKRNKLYNFNSLYEMFRIEAAYVPQYVRIKEFEIYGLNKVINND